MVLFKEHDFSIDFLDLAAFYSFTVLTSSQTTSQIANYTLQFQIGDGLLNTSHLIKFKCPAEVQYCDLNTIVPVLPTSSFIGATAYTGYKNYSLELSEIVGAYTVIKFEIECRNAYTTMEAEWFVIWALDEYKNEFYNGTASLLPMTIINNFTQLTYTFQYLFPSGVTSVTFHLVSSTPHDIVDADQILVTLVPEMDLAFGCSAENISGVFGTLLCSIAQHVITIYGISRFKSDFTFKLNFLRNPSNDKAEIFFTVLSKHSLGYEGETLLSNSVYLSCNFPCKTCSPNDPDFCTSCFDEADPAFLIYSNEYYILYINTNKCLWFSPIYTYMNTPTTCKSITLSLYIYIYIYRL